MKSGIRSHSQASLWGSQMHSQMQALPKNVVPEYELRREFNVPALEIFLDSSRNLRGQEMKKTQGKGLMFLSAGDRTASTA